MEPFLRKTAVDRKLERAEAEQRADEYETRVNQALMAARLSQELQQAEAAGAEFGERLGGSCQGEAGQPGANGRRDGGREAGAARGTGERREAVSMPVGGGGVVGNGVGSPALSKDPRTWQAAAAGGGARGPVGRPATAAPGRSAGGANTGNGVGSFQLSSFPGGSPSGCRFAASKVSPSKVTPSKVSPSKVAAAPAGPLEGGVAGAGARWQQQSAPGEQQQQPLRLAARAAARPSQLAAGAKQRLTGIALRGRQGEAGEGQLAGGRQGPGAGAAGGGEDVIARGQDEAHVLVSTRATLSLREGCVGFAGW